MKSALQSSQEPLFDDPSAEPTRPMLRLVEAPRAQEPELARPRSIALAAGAVATIAAFAFLLNHWRVGTWGEARSHASLIESLRAMVAAAGPRSEAGRQLASASSGADVLTAARELAASK